MSIADGVSIHIFIFEIEFVDFELSPAFKIPVIFNFIDMDTDLQISH